MYFDSTQGKTSSPYTYEEPRLSGIQIESTLYVFTFYYLLSYCSNPYMFIFWSKKTRDGALG